MLKSNAKQAEALKVLQHLTLHAGVEQEKKLIECNAVAGVVDVLHLGQVELIRLAVQLIETVFAHKRTQIEKVMNEWEVIQQLAHSPHIVHAEVLQAVLTFVQSSGRTDIPGLKIASLMLQPDLSDQVRY